MTFTRKRYYVMILYGIFFFPSRSFSQLRWTNMDADYGPLPPAFHVYKTTDSLGGKPFIAYYAKASLKDNQLDFTTDTTRKRRITPLKFFERDDHPLLVVNCSFFSYETNGSLNIVMRNGKILYYNSHTIPMRGKDTFQYRHPLVSAIGIDKNRHADIAWLLTDSSKRFAFASQLPPVRPVKDSVVKPTFKYLRKLNSSFTDSSKNARYALRKWKMRTAVGGGPVLVQDGRVMITNEEELKFTGKAINDKHPRTAMGYTRDGYLVILLIQGRFPGIAEGATLEQEARILIDLGCVEALNLDGGGSSCMLINGKETIKPSEKGEERPVPAVFLIKNKR